MSWIRLQSRFARQQAAPARLDSSALTADRVSTRRSSKDDNALEAVTTEGEGVIIDSVFGQGNQDGLKYRNMGWIRASILMMKTQLGIGTLSIPKAFATLGLIPGLIVLTLFFLLTTWSAWTIGEFKKKHPEVYGLDDVGDLMFGRVGKEVFQTAFMLYYIFVAGSGFVSVATGLNILSNHAACDTTYVLSAAIAGLVLCSIPTLSKVSWVAWVGLVSIVVSIFALLIAVGIQDRPANAPATGPWRPDFKVIGDPTFAQAMSAIASLIFSFSGTSAFFPITAEMRDQRMYFKAVALCQSVIYIAYVVVGIVTYYYCGSYVGSPALGSAGHVMEKVCYGLALPGLLVTTMIVCHLPAKSIFVRMLRGSRHLTATTWLHWLVWLSCTLLVVVVGYVIASGIPAFEGLVELIGASLGTLLAIQIYGMMWLYDNWGASRGRWWTVGVCWSVFVVIFGLFCMAAGSYGAVQDIISLYRKSKSVAWACDGSLES